MSEQAKQRPKRLQVGEFAKIVGKTVRALHLYEELGLLNPVDRSKGGFRLYDETSIERARWIVKLQGIGFTLAQIQGFVADFEQAATGRLATSHARDVFTEKLNDVQTQLAKLRRSEADLVEALNYLAGCHNCEGDLPPAHCRDCVQQTSDEVPHLFAGLSETAGQRDAETKPESPVMLKSVGSNSESAHNSAELAQARSE